MANLFAPIVDIIKKQVEISTSLLLKDMISVFDLDGNPITRYRFRDNGFLNYSGFFTVNGVKQNAGSWIEVDASQLHLVRFNAGLIPTAESIGVQVYDGKFWSIADYDAIQTIAFNGYAPEIIATNGTILESETRTITDGDLSSLEGDDLFSVYDRDGDQPTRFFIVDRSTFGVSGRFTLNGVSKPQGQFFLVEANELSGLRYVGGGYGPVSEQIGVMAYDGKYWSAVKNFWITTTANQFAPILTPKNISSGLSGVTDAANLFDVSDPDGNTIKLAWFLDTGVSPTSGFFSVNGVQQAAGSFFQVPFRNLDTVKYHFSGLPEIEELRMQVWDGRYVSPIMSATATAIPTPTIDVPDTTVVLDTLQTVLFSSLFTQSDAGPDFTRYEVVDRDADLTSARIVDHNGSRLLGNQVYTYTPGQFASVRIEGAQSDLKRGYEEVMVRAFNGQYWTEWQTFDVATEHVGPRSLTSGTRWGSPAVTPTIVTYSFIDSNFDPGPCRHPRLPLYYSCTVPDQENDNTQVLSPGQRAMVREVLANISTFANIQFVERGYDPFGTDIMTMFGVNNQNGSQAYAYLPASNGNASRIGDIWLHGGMDDNPTDGGVTDPLHPQQAIFNAPGGQGRATVIHEVGHSIGFRHPFDTPIGLPVSTDNEQFTIMSYTGGVNTTSVPATFMLYDIMEAQRLYGVNTTYRTGDDGYQFNLTNTYLQSIWDAGGTDTFNYSNMTMQIVSDLRQGQYSALNGDAHLLIPFGVDIENVRGGSNDDTLIGNGLRNLLFGNNGNDIFVGNGGNDILRGAAGNDTYRWSPGDGNDVIDEEGQAGRDVIEIHDFAGSLDTLQDDLVFRRLGVDMRIDLTFNRAETLGSIRIKNQDWGGFRIETLRLFDASGVKVGNDIDLTSIMAQVGSQATRFQLTNFQTVFGYIAQPV